MSDECDTDETAEMAATFEAMQTLWLLSKERYAEWLARREEDEQ